MCFDRNNVMYVNLWHVWQCQEANPYVQQLITVDAAQCINELGQNIERMQKLMGESSLGDDQVSQSCQRC